MAYEEIASMEKEEIVSLVGSLQTTNEELLKNLEELRSINKAQYEENIELKKKLEAHGRCGILSEKIDWSLEELARKQSEILNILKSKQEEA